MKKIIKFIYVFIIIGFESLGNMSAVTAVLEENLIKKNKYVTEEDLIDAITVARIGPGATTANAVAYLGNKIAGFWGGALATICYTIAPLIVILLIAKFFEKILEYSVVTSALKGALVYLSVTLIKSTIGMGKNILTNKFNVTVFVCALIVSLFTGISSVLIIICAVIIRFCKRKDKVC